MLRPGGSYTAPIQRVYRKSRIKIGAESVKFDTCQIRTDQTRMILKKGWISDLEILEICRRIDCEEYEQDTLPELKR